VALSTAEAEFISLSECARELVSLQNLILELKLLEPKMIPIFCDNKAAISQVHSENISQRCRHLDVKYHHIRQLERDKVIDVKWISTDDQLADALTKAVPKQILDRFQLGLSHQSSFEVGGVLTAPSVGDCCTALTTESTDQVAAPLS